MSTAISDARAEAMAKIRASKLRAAGLVGEYARADCELGHRLYELAKEGVGAYVHGESGRGKTYAASCAVRMWVDAGGKARLVSAPKLMEEIYAGFERDGDKHALDRACRIPLLALDDFGMERPTETAIEKLSVLVDERVKAGLPTIFTSNVRIGVLSNSWGEVPGKRLASRVIGSCRIIEVAGEDWRVKCRP